MHHKRAKRILAAACCACLLAGTARADEPGDAGAKKFELLCPPWQWDTATHEYMGIRPELGARGCTLDITLTADWAKNVMGGLNTDGYNFGHLLNASLTLDTEKMKLWKGGTFFLNFQNENGEFATADAGDIQVADNIDADGRTQISELWYGQKFFDDKLEIRVGKIDPNAEMGTSPISAEFINSSPGALPTILGMPLYPDPSTGALALFDEEHFYLDLGVFDGATQAGIATGDKGPATLFGSPSALFLIGEGGPKWRLKEGTLAGKLGVGVWHHPAASIGSTAARTAAPAASISCSTSSSTGKTPRARTTIKASASSSATAGPTRTSASSSTPSSAASRAPAAFQRVITM